MAANSQCSLSSKQCVPCQGETPPLEGQALEDLMKQVQGWELVEDKKILKNFKFKDFMEALAFVNRVGELAQQQGHHPDIYLSWGKVKIELSTHKIKGLTESDVILAAKIDTLMPEKPGNS